MIFNLGIGTGFSVFDIIKEVEKVTGQEINLERGESRADEYASMVAFFEKASKLLGWTSQRELQDLINSLVKWYQVYRNGWEY